MKFRAFRQYWNISYNDPLTISTKLMTPHFRINHNIQEYTYLEVSVRMSAIKLILNTYAVSVKGYYIPAAAPTYLLYIFM